MNNVKYDNTLSKYFQSLPSFWLFAYTYKLHNFMKRMNPTRMNGLVATNLARAVTLPLILHAYYLL